MPIKQFYNLGEQVVRRGVVGQRVWIAHPVTVVKDSPEQTILLLVPGSVCKFPAGLVERKYSDKSNARLSRWDEQDGDSWTFREWRWQQKRFLIFLKPESYFSLQLVWDHATDSFLGWYVNFEMPFSRSHAGFDTLDLELDLIIKPDGRWQWKDERQYQEGVRRGSISPETAQQVEQARADVLTRLKMGTLPLHRSWITWRPEPAWGIAQLPADWERVEEGSSFPPRSGQ